MQNNIHTNATKCGYVAIIGAPNAGKSTLVNHLVGQQISIVTHKAQTTRCRVTGIAIQDSAQIIFHDLPGIFEPSSKRNAKNFEKAMVGAAWSALADADMGLVLIDASKPVTKGQTGRIIDSLESMNDRNTPLILALNKTDLVAKDSLLPLTESLNNKIDFEATFMISARKGTGCKDLMTWLADKMPEGPWLYDPDDVTDMPAKLLAAEFTREKILENLHQEIPYGITVQTNLLQEVKGNALKIEQEIFVRKKSHKAMVIGRKGQTLKRIGTAARITLEKIFTKRVHLNLIVRVDENWVEDPQIYRMWGLDRK